MSEQIILKCDLSNDFIPRGQMDKEVIARIELYAHDTFARQHPVTNCDVIIVVDTSGSMNEPFAAGVKFSKREGVKQAIEAMLPTFKHGDTASLICYDSNVYVEMDRVKGSEKDRMRAALPAIDRHSGSTNFEKAFQFADNLLSACQNPSRKIIFLTDGNSTEGTITEARRHNDAIRAKGGSVDCLGVGGDFDFKFMQSFTAVTNGNTRLLASPVEAKLIFEELLVGAQSSPLSNVTLRLAFPAGTRDLELAQASPEKRWLAVPRPKSDGSVDIHIPVQSMTHIHNYRYLARFNLNIPADASIPNHPLFKARVDYDVPVLGLKSQSLELDTRANLSDDKTREVNDTSIATDFQEALLAKYDGELNAAFQRKDKEAMIELFKTMKAIAVKIPNRELVDEYQRRFEKLLKVGELTQDDMNNLSASTSKATKIHRVSTPAGGNNKSY